MYTMHIYIPHVLYSRILYTLCIMISYAQTSYLNESLPAATQISIIITNGVHGSPSAHTHLTGIQMHMCLQMCMIATHVSSYAYSTGDQSDPDKYSSLHAVWLRVHMYRSVYTHIHPRLPLRIHGVYSRVVYISSETKCSFCIQLD